MKLKIKFILLVLFLFSSSIAHAVDVSITATLDTDEITVEDSAVVTVSVVGALTAPAPMPPVVQGLKIQRRAGRGSSITIINGQTNISAEYYFDVVADVAGNFKIPPFTVSIGGKNYQSNELQVAVVANNYNAPIQNLPGNHGIYTQNPQTPPTQDHRTGPDFWLSTTVSNPNPYQSEQVLFHFRLYTREQVSQGSASLPEFNDFLNEVIENDKRSSEVVNGREYATWEKVVALTPLKPGSFTIDGGKMDLAYQVVQKGRQNSMDPFFNNPFFNQMVQTTKQSTIKAPPVTIEVKPLPTPVPADFTGLVGKFGVQSSLSDNKVTEGESVTYNISLSGSGNVKEALLPDLKFPDFKTYVDKPTVETYKSNGTISGKKQFKIALVPTRSGKLTIPGVTLSYFDPKTEKYVELSIADQEIEVAPSQEEKTNTVLTANSTDKSVSTEAISYQDIAPVISDAKQALKDNGIVISNLWFVIGLAGCPILFIAFFLFKRISFGSMSPAGKKRQRLAYKELMTVLASSKPVGSTIIEALRKYFSSLYQIEGNSLTAKEMAELCLKHGFAKELSEKLGKAVEALEAQQFSFDKDQAIVTSVKDIKFVVEKVNAGKNTL